MRRSKRHLEEIIAFDQSNAGGINGTLDFLLKLGSGGRAIEEKYTGIQRAIVGTVTSLAWYAALK